MPAPAVPSLQQIFLFLMGAALLLAAWRQHRHHARLLREGELVRGTVLRLERDRRSYYPVLRFCTHRQQWITARYHIGSRPASYAEGEEVAIRYHPADPQNFTIVGAESGATVWLLGLIGAGLLLYGLVGYLRA